MRVLAKASGAADLAVGDGSRRPTGHDCTVCLFFSPLRRSSPLLGPPGGISLAFVVLGAPYSVHAPSTARLVMGRQQAPRGHHQLRSEE